MTSKTVLRMCAFFLIFFISIIVYGRLFVEPILVGGDAHYIYPEMFRNYPVFPYAWSAFLGNGLGGSAVAFLASTTLTNIPLDIFGLRMGLSWSFVEKLGQLLPFLFLGAISPWLLFRKLFKSTTFAYVASGIYLINTYILMVISGGLTVMGIGYALVPLILYFVVMLFDEKKLQVSQTILFACIFCLLICIDIRFTYMACVAGALYGLLSLLVDEKPILNVRKIAISFLPIFIAACFSLLAFWIIPLTTTRDNPIASSGVSYTSDSAVRFFSFARLENTLSLLHPNWPQNIFGKVPFFNGLFLILPLLAYSSLFFIQNASKKERKSVVLFAVVGLVGAFLAKGTNEPLGVLYLYFFKYIPGFVMFRDPTKWYVLVALSYSLLIPFTLLKLSEKAGNYIKAASILIVLIFTIFWAATVHEAVLGQLTGIFVTRHVPDEYQELANYLYNQSGFSRTLWIPTTQRFLYTTTNHPAVDGELLFNTTNYRKLLNQVAKSNSETLLKFMGVTYIVVPYDSEKEIYIKDNKNNEEEFHTIVSELEKISWLKRIDGFNDIAVFQTADSSGHFITTDNQTIISARTINPVDYTLQIKNAKKGDGFYFSESFDPRWQIFLGTKSVSPTNVYGIMQFSLPASGNYSLDLRYKTQKTVNRSAIIGIISLAIFGLSMLYMHRKKLAHHTLLHMKMKKSR